MRNRRAAIFALAAVAILLSLVLATACAGAAPTPTPIPPAPPAPPTAPTAVPQPTATLAPGVPTPVPATPTPTRVLPTPTPAVQIGPKYGGTLRFVYRLDIDTMDPAYSSLPGMYQVYYTIYNQPFRLDQLGQLQPDLAESWSFSADGKTITLKLRQGVKFHDGTDFNAQAFKWNYDRFMDPNALSLRRPELTPYVKEVRVIDNYTVAIDFFEAFRPLLFQLASERMGWLVSPAAVAKYGGGRDGNYGRNPVGTGPFIFKEWVPDGNVQVRRNANYWEKGKPYLDGILFQAAKDQTVMLAMLRTGETDGISAWEVRTQDVPLIRRDSNLVVYENKGSATAILHFNASKKPFDNQALRQAISYGMDRKKFVDVVLIGAGLPATTFIPAGWAHNPDLKPIDYNPTMAKQKLAEAGYPSGISIPMGCPPTGVYFDQCEFTQAVLKDVGINVNIELVENATYFSMVADQGYYGRQGFGNSRWGYRVDPHTVIQALWHKGGFKNLGTYDNPELSRLIDEAATVYDTAKAKPLYDRIQTMAMEAATAPALAWVTLFHPMHKSIKNFEVRPTVFEHLEFVWLEK